MNNCCPKSRRPLPSRRFSALRRARALATQYDLESFETNASNSNETNQKNRTPYIDSFDGACPWVYGKSLEHHPQTLFVMKKGLDKLIAFIETPSEEALKEVALVPSARPLEDLCGSLTFEPAGLDASHSKFTRIGKLFEVKARSNLGFFEMTEIYAISMVRDVKFAEWDNSDVVSSVFAALKHTHTRLNLRTNPPSRKALFRMDLADVNHGSFISQLLILDVSHGNLSFSQKYAPESEVHYDKKSCLDMLNGMQPADPPRLLSPQPLHSLNVLAGMVHKDPLFSFYYNAALILHNKTGTQIGGSNSSSNFLNGGIIDLLSCLGSVARVALRTAWWLKWKNLKLRPEEFAARIQLAAEISKKEAGDIPGFLELKERMKNDEVLRLIKEKNRSYFLTMLYKEGAPVHPSFPSGHATVAGACCTVLKCFLRTRANGESRKWSDVMGLGSIGVDSGETIDGEINKLAMNVSVGRNAAGVHYSSDNESGVRIGEQTAIFFLRSRLMFYTSKIAASGVKLEFESFDRQIITI